MTRAPTAATATPTPPHGLSLGLLGGTGCADLLNRILDSRVLLRADRSDIPYEKGAEAALATAESSGFTVVSVEDDWEAVFPPMPLLSNDAS